MRRSNELKVLEELYRHSPATRAGLAKQVGLTKPTVSAALTTLIGSELVERVGGDQSASKYGAELFRSAGRSLPVLGVDVGTRFVRVQLAGLDDVLLAAVEEELPEPTLVAVFDSILRLRERVCAEAGIDPVTIQAVGVGIPGVVRPQTQRVAMAGGIEGLNGCDLSEGLGDLLGTPIVVENDVNVAAIAEHRYGACAGQDDFAMISVGAGVGVAIVLGGRLRGGARGSAGEVDRLFGDSTGRLLADPSSDSMISFAEEQLSANSPVSTPAPVSTPVSMVDVFVAASSGDSFAQGVVDEAGRRIAELCACVVAIVDIETVVLVGGIGAAMEQGRTALEARLNELVPWPTTVIQSTLGRSGTVMGARSLAIDAARQELFTQRIGKTLYDLV